MGLPPEHHPVSGTLCEEPDRGDLSGQIPHSRSEKEFFSTVATEYAQAECSICSGSTCSEISKYGQRSDVCCQDVYTCFSPKRSIAIANASVQVVRSRSRMTVSETIEKIKKPDRLHSVNRLIEVSIDLSQGEGRSLHPKGCCRCVCSTNSISPSTTDDLRFFFFLYSNDLGALSS